MEILFLSGTEITSIIWTSKYSSCNLKDKPGMLFKSTRIYLMHIICLYTHAIDKNMDNNGKH